MVRDPIGCTQMRHQNPARPCVNRVDFRLLTHGESFGTQTREEGYFENRLHPLCAEFY